MGKTSKPLNLLVDQDLYDLYDEEFERLRAQGHTITTQQFQSHDLVLAKRAWRWVDPKLLEVTLKAARKARYT